MVFDQKYQRVHYKYIYFDKNKKIIIATNFL